MRAGAARAVARPLSLLVPVGAALWTWWPLLRAYFYADDFVHLFDLVTLGPARFLTQVWAGHLYLVRNAVWIGLYEAFGAEPRPWLWCALITHLVNVALLHHVIRRLGGGLAVACVGATVWGTAPLLEGALGWVAVHGQVLLTTVVLVLLARVAAVAAGPRTLSLPAALSWGTLVLVGGGCFGIGLGLAVAWPLAVAIGLPPARRTRGALLVLVLAAAVLLGIYAAASSATAAHLDPRQRALLSPPALLAELPAALVLTGQLVAYGAFALPLGFLGLPHDAPATTMTIGGLLAGTLAVAGWLAGDVSARRMQVALVLLAIAAYATVAIGRTTAIEFLNVPSLHAAAWPRYHYLGLALLVLAACRCLAAVRSRGPWAAGAVAGAALTWTALRLVVLILRPPALDLHDGPRAETTATLARIRTAIAATSPGGTTVIDNRPFGSAAVPWLFPGTAGLFVIHFPENSVDGRTVRFRASDADWRLAQARGGRIAALVERRDAATPVTPGSRAP